jgi:hypothetical protein
MDKNQIYPYHVIFYITSFQVSMDIDGHVLNRLEPNKDEFGSDHPEPTTFGCELRQRPYKNPPFWAQLAYTRLEIGSFSIFFFPSKNPTFFYIHSWIFFFFFQLHDEKN